MATKKFEILVLNSISQVGLKRFPAEAYRIAKDGAHPDAILVRSHEMNAMKVPDSVRAIGRAGAGTNNIPVKEMSGRGVPVFNAPGANANAVKELVLAGMLMAARNLVPAVRFVGSLNCDDETLAELREPFNTVDVTPSTPEEFAGLIQREIPKWRKVFEAAKIQPECPYDEPSPWSPRLSLLHFCSLTSVRVSTGNSEVRIKGERVEI